MWNLLSICTLVYFVDRKEWDFLPSGSMWPGLVGTRLNIFAMYALFHTPLDNPNNTLQIAPEIGTRTTEAFF